MESCWVHFLIWSIYWIDGFPLFRFPFIFAVVTMFSSCPFLITCPKNDTCRCRIFCINFRFPIVSLSTCSFVFFSFQLIFCIRRINHISVASSLLICCWFNIQFSHPYRNKGMTWQFKIRYLKSNGILRLASIFFMSRGTSPHLLVVPPGGQCC